MLERVEVGLFMQQFVAEEVKVDILSDFHLMIQERLFVIAIRNIVDNAVKYSQGSSVRITVSHGLVVIQDCGIGIPPNDLPYIFAPFYRAGNTGRVAGHGIGLALSKEIIEKFGGRLSVKSVIGQGTVFKIDFR
jgi:signal transduction histidine kinase